MNCPICKSALRPAFSALVLYKHKAIYEYCAACGFLCAREPHWLEEAYSSAIAAADTGLVMRNISLASKVASVLRWVLGERGTGRYLDAAGGYGMLTRLMRDLGFDFFWTDKYCPNLLARGFEYAPAVGPCRAVTAMEVLEHLGDPITFVEETLRSAGADTLLFSTELFVGDPPNPGDWWYYTFPTGQHISFFQRRTLEMLGQRLALRFESANGLHILSRHSIDRTAFKLATNPYICRIATPLIRRWNGSRTLDDHQQMMRHSDLQQ
jgi:hypothetical protein